MWTAERSLPTTLWTAERSLPTTLWTAERSLPTTLASCGRFQRTFHQGKAQSRLLESPLPLN